MNINEKLLKIQIELKAPKGQYNSFGKYKYRSCEDILEAVKPLLQENKCTLTIKDDMEQIGNRYYIKATATLIDVEAPEDTMDMTSKTITRYKKEISNTAYAREEESKKGMDGSQITGTASSYARKYALNGLFLIDDTKDADTNEFKEQQESPKINKVMEEALRQLIKNEDVSNEFVISVLQRYNYKKLADIDIFNLKEIENTIKSKQF